MKGGIYLYKVKMNLNDLLDKTISLLNNGFNINKGICYFDESTGNFDISNNMSMSYYFDNWFTSYYIFTDIEALGILIYKAYPIGLILIGLTLFIVMVGILSICFPTINNKKNS